MCAGDILFFFLNYFSRKYFSFDVAGGPSISFSSLDFVIGEIPEKKKKPGTISLSILDRYLIDTYGQLSIFCF